MPITSGRATQARSQFATTRWSLIVSARGETETTSRGALAELCQSYWYPLYAFARRRGCDAESAADLVQGFFVELIDGALLQSADPLKGRFRSYLLGAFKHFMSNEHDRASAKKRGGGVAAVSLGDAETRYAAEPADNLSPERLFERRWALTALDRVMQSLADEYQKPGRQRQFEQLKNLLAGPLPDRSYADIAAELEMTEGAIKTAVHRLRQRYRELLTAQIAETLDSPAEVEDEIRHLYAAISRSA